MHRELRAMQEAGARARLEEDQAREWKEQGDNDADGRAFMEQLQR